MSKPTYSDIAARAGVGTATVERVLNGRGGVRPVTVEKVLVAAREMDWPGRLPEVHRGLMRIEVILVRPETSFFGRLATAFRRIASSLDPSVQVHVTFMPESDPKAIAARITDRSIRRSGLVISSPDTPEVRAALERVRANGLPVIQVVTRVIEDAHFVGIDNYAAGRMAGMMVARLGAVRGPVVALCHSQVYSVHRDRLRGFSDYLAENPVGTDFVHVQFSGDDPDQTSERLFRTLQQWPDLAAIYNAGGANEAVVDMLKRKGRKVFVVAHELDERASAALKDGTVDVILDQLPEAQARRSLDILLSEIGILKDPISNPPMRFTTITRENL